MQTLVTRIVIGLIRYLLQGVSGWLVGRSIVSEEDWATLVAGIGTFVVISAWMAYDKWREQRASQGGGE